MWILNAIGGFIHSIEKLELLYILYYYSAGCSNFLRKLWNFLLDVVYYRFFSFFARHEAYREGRFSFNSWNWRYLRWDVWIWNTLLKITVSSVHARFYRLPSFDNITLELMALSWIEKDVGGEGVHTHYQTFLEVQNWTN